MIIKISSILLGTGLSVLAADKLVRYNKYKRANLFLDEGQMKTLLKDKKLGDLKLHPSYVANTTAKKRVVVVGGGIVGAGQTYYLKKLCKDDVDVVLIDKSSDFVTGTSYANAGFMHTA